MSGHLRRRLGPQKSRLRTKIDQSTLCFRQRANFHLAQNTLDLAWSQATMDSAVQSYCASVGIDWKFIPAHAPWQGGAYERNGWPGETMPAEVSCPPSHCAEPNGDSRYRNRSCCQLPSTDLRLCRSAVRTATHACQLPSFLVPL